MGESRPAIRLNYRWLNDDDPAIEKALHLCASVSLWF